MYRPTFLELGARIGRNFVPEVLEHVGGETGAVEAGRPRSA